MLSLYKLVLRTNIKSPIILFPLIFPFILLLMYSVTVPNGLTEAQVDQYIASMLVTVIALTTMQSGLMGFGFNFMNMKHSVLLKRVGATKINKFEVLGAFFLYGITVWFISIVWIFALILILSASGMFYSFPIDPMTGGAILDGTKTVGHLKLNSLNWGKLFASTIVMVYLSYSLGLFFVSVAKDDLTFQAIVMLYFFSVGILGGMMIPGEIPTWMVDVGYLIPHSYANELYSLSVGTVVVGESTSNVASITTSKFVLDIIIPIIVGTTAIFGATKFLKFS